MVNPATKTFRPSFGNVEIELQKQYTERQVADGCNCSGRTYSFIKLIAHEETALVWNALTVIPELFMKVILAPFAMCVRNDSENGGRPLLDTFNSIHPLTTIGNIPKLIFGLISTILLALQLKVQISLFTKPLDSKFEKNNQMLIIPKLLIRKKTRVLLIPKVMIMAQAQLQVQQDLTAG